MNVRDLMTEEVVTVDVTATVGDVMDTMLTCDVRHVPVVDGNTLRGMVSDRDVRSLARPEADAEGARRRLRVDLAMPVIDAMQSDVISVTPEDDVTDLLDMMIDYKVGAVPVSDDGVRLLGIVSYIDVLRAARSALA